MPIKPCPAALVLAMHLGRTTPTPGNATATLATLVIVTGIALLGRFISNLGARTGIKEPALTASTPAGSPPVATAAHVSSHLHLPPSK